MKWIPLHLTKTAEVERQVDEVCRTLALLCRQKESSSNAAQVAKAKQVLVQSIHERIRELEQFYLENDLDVRASKIEQSRIKLKRGLAACGFSVQQPALHGAGAARQGSDTTPMSSQPTPQHGHLGFPSEPSAIAAAAVSPELTPSSSANYSSLLNPSTFDLSGHAMRSPQSAVPYGTAPRAATEAGLQAREDDANGPQVLLRVVMSQEDFEELKMRRAAISKFLRGGGGASSR